MVYGGWGHDELLEAGRVPDEIDNWYSIASPEHPVAAFTPINNQTINPQQTLLAPGLDSDSLYGMHEEGTSDSRPTKPKSKKRAHTTTGRAVSFSAVWEYEDEGDLAHHNNGSDFETQLPQRRKLPQKKRLRSLKTPVVEEVAESEDDIAKQVSKVAEASYLNTPPEAVKRPKSKGRVASKVKATGGVFQNAIVTKTSVSREKDVMQEQLDPGYKSTYQGYTTTQDTLKSNTFSLSKTTMDKLNSFRFRQSSQSKVDTASQQTPQLISEDREPEQITLPEDYSIPDEMDFGDYVQPTQVPQVLDACYDQGNADEIALAAPLPLVSRHDDRSLVYGTLVNADLDGGYDNSDPSDGEMNVTVSGDARNTVVTNNQILDEDPIVTLDSNNDDEFDDGLEDDDFLAVIDNLVTLETTSTTAQGRAATSQHVLPITPSNPAGFAGGTLKMQASTSQSLLLSESASKPHASETDGEDEYGMDANDEEGLLKLLEPVGKVQEVDVPPTSVQNAYDYDREVYDSSLQFSPPKSTRDSVGNNHLNGHSSRQSPGKAPGADPLPLDAEEDWGFIHANNSLEKERGQISPPTLNRQPQSAPPRVVMDLTLSQPRRAAVSRAHTTATQETNTSTWMTLDDSHEYEPMEPFARPPFPALVMDRCPVIGLSASVFMRTCFRIGEMIQQGAKCHYAGQDAIIELFARVNFSSRESGTSKQHFQFLDLWHDRQPYPIGILASYRTTGLVESESRVFLPRDGEPREENKMARVLGRLRRNKKNETWWLDIINIRETDWEEIRWTKRIVSGDDLVEKIKEEAAMFENLSSKTVTAARGIVESCY